MTTRSIKELETYLGDELRGLTPLVASMFGVTPRRVGRSLAIHNPPAEAPTPAEHTAASLSLLLHFAYTGSFPDATSDTILPLRTSVYTLDPEFDAHLENLSRGLVTAISTAMGHASERYVCTILKRNVGPVGQLNTDGWYNRARYTLDEVIPHACHVILRGLSSSAAKQPQNVPEMQLNEWNAAKAAFLDDMRAILATTSYTRGEIQSELKKQRGPIAKETVEGLAARRVLMHRLYDPPTPSEVPHGSIG